MAASKQRLLQNADKFLQRGSYDRAIRALKKAIELDPRDIQIRKKLGEAYYRHGKQDDAAAEFLALADYFRSGGLLPKAVAMYKRSLQIQPKRSKIRFQLAELYNELGMRADAVAHLRKLAEITQADGNIDDQVEVWEKLVTLDPSRTEFVQRLNEHYRRIGDKPSALRLWRSQAEASRIRADEESMIAALEQIVALRPEDVEAATQVGQLYLDRGEAQKALARLQPAYESHPEDVKLLEQLARAFSRLEEFEQADLVLAALMERHISLGDTVRADRIRSRRKRLKAVQPSEKVEVSVPVIFAGEPSNQGVARVLIRSKVMERYGFTGRAFEEMALLTDQDAGAPMVLRQRCFELAMALDRTTDAVQVLKDGYAAAIGAHDKGTAHAALRQAVSLAPSDAELAGRLRQFEAMYGEVLGLDASQLSSKPGLDFSDGFGDDLGDDFDDELDLGGRSSELSSSAPIELGGAAPSAPIALDASNPSLPVDDDLSFLDDLDLSMSLPAEPEGSLYEQGQDQLIAGNFAAAAERFRSAIDAGVEVESSHHALGASLEGMGDWAGAVRQYRTMIQVLKLTGEDLFGVMFELGRCYQEAGDRNRALQVLGRLSQAHSGYRDGELARRLAEIRGAVDS